jgi:hypothetical protein
MTRTIRALAILLAMAASTMSAPIDYTLIGKIVPTLEQPDQFGYFAANLLLGDGGAGGHVDVIYDNGHGPLSYDFSIAANVPGPPDFRVYASPDGENVMQLVDWDGGAGTAFTNLGWDDTSGNAGWDLWNMNWDVKTGPALSGSVTSVIEGKHDLPPLLPVCEPAAGVLGLFACLGILTLGYSSSRTRRF